MEDTHLERAQWLIRILAKEVVIATLGLIDDEKLDPEIQYGWIQRIQEASDEEMPELLDNIKHELQMLSIDTTVLH